MKKFIEYAVKLILIVLVLLAYQSMSAYAIHQAASTYGIWWTYLSYYALVFGHIVCGMIIAYNEHKSGKASVTKFVLSLIAIFLIIYPFGLIGGTFFLQNHAMSMELVRVLSIIFGILLTGLKL